MSLTTEQKISLIKFRDNQFDVDQLGLLIERKLLSLELCTNNEIHNINSSVLLEIVKKIIRNDQIKNSILEIEGLTIFSDTDKCNLAYLHLAKFDKKSEKFQDLLKIYHHNRLIDEDLIITEKQLVNRKEFNQLIGREMSPRIIEAIEVYLDNYSDLPEPEKDRTNIFVLGLVGAGKSVFLVGLLYHIYRSGNLRLINRNNIAGSNFIDLLMEYFEKGYLPPATPEDLPIYIEADIITENQKTIPVNLFDMSGEIFRQAYGKQLSNMPKNFLKYLNQENNKVFVLTINYGSKNSSFEQARTFTSILTTLAEQNVLNYTISVCLLITKWDISGLVNESEEVQANHAREFLNTYYLNLKRTCEEFSQRFNFDLRIFAFSLGTIDKYDQSIDFNPTYANNLYQWISTLPIKPEKKSNAGLFSKLFK
jgi:hypothetical protein